MEVKRADAVTKEDEIIFWSKGIFNLHESKGLFNAVFFYNGKVLALRGRSEHRNLLIEQFQFKETVDKKKLVEFWPIVRKNFQGDIQQTKIRQQAIRQFDTDEPNSYYKILRKYIECLGESTGPFYRRPLSSNDGPRFSKQVVGHNILGIKLKNLFKQAGIEDDRTISNHGLRVTSATTMFDAGFDSRTISMRTGHKSSAVNNYIRESQKLQMEVSQTLEPVKMQDNQEIVDNDEEKKETNTSAVAVSKKVIETNTRVFNEAVTEVTETFSEDVTETNIQENSKESPIFIAVMRGSKKVKISL